MVLEERVEFLEKEYNRLYHTDEMLSILVPRLADTIAKYLKLTHQYHNEVLRDLKNFRSYIELLDEDLREHFKSHYLDKKKREGYASKQKTDRYNEYVT